MNSKINSTRGFKAYGDFTVEFTKVGLLSTTLNFVMLFSDASKCNTCRFTMEFINDSH